MLQFIIKYCTVKVKQKSKWVFSGWSILLRRCRWSWSNHVWIILYYSRSESNSRTSPKMNVNKQRQLNQFLPWSVWSELWSFCRLSMNRHPRIVCLGHWRIARDRGIQQFWYGIFCHYMLWRTVMLIELFLTVEKYLTKFTFEVAPLISGISFWITVFQYWKFSIISSREWTTTHTHKFYWPHTEVVYRVKPLLRWKKVQYISCFDFGLGLAIFVDSWHRLNFDELLGAMPVDQGELLATVVVLAAVPYFHHMLKMFSYLSRFDMKF